MPLQSRTVTSGFVFFSSDKAASHVRLSKSEQVFSCEADMLSERLVSRVSGRSVFGSGVLLAEECLALVLFNSWQRRPECGRLSVHKNQAFPLPSLPLRSSLCSTLPRFQQWKGTNAAWTVFMVAVALFKSAGTFAQFLYLNQWAGEELTLAVQTHAACDAGRRHAHAALDPSLACFTSFFRFVQTVAFRLRSLALWLQFAPHFMPFKKNYNNTQMLHAHTSWMFLI